VKVKSMPGFRKTKDANWADAFAAEADGLEALRPHIRAPKVLDLGIEGGKAFILLEHLDLRGGGDYAALGRMLAAVHRETGPRFGWARDNYIGLSPQQNGGCDEWAEFWLEKRMRPQFAWAMKKGFKLEMPDLTLLDGHHPQPSLLHGDLWNGNAGFTADGPVVFDPAVYYGDRETDLAMTELFGGFPAEFYRAYNEAFPLSPGYDKRKPLYNLYHLLNHLNIFGGGYLAQVKATLRLLAGRL
jgi:protein-ribulosamine 3-kinase